MEDFKNAKSTDFFYEGENENSKYEQIKGLIGMDSWVVIYNIGLPSHKVPWFRRLSENSVIVTEFSENFRNHWRSTWLKLSGKSEIAGSSQVSKKQKFIPAHS